MNFDFKPILASRTVWSNIIGLIALALAAFGFDNALGDTQAQAQLVDHVLNVVAALSFVAAIIFRARATTRLGSP